MNAAARARFEAGKAKILQDAPAKYEELRARSLSMGMAPDSLPTAEDFAREQVESLRRMYADEYGADTVADAAPAPTANEALPAAVLAANDAATVADLPAPSVKGMVFAGSRPFMEELMERYKQIPEFVREDVLEGLLVGGGIALPVALMPNQDANERAAALLGGIAAATLGGAAARRIGAEIGGRLHPAQLKEGSFGSNLGRVMGREDLMDPISDMMGTTPAPVITGREYGRALGRAVGDEVFGVGGAIGALALAQAMDATPDPVPQPTMGEVALGVIPGAALGLVSSGLGGGLMDSVGMIRAAEDGTLGNDSSELLSRYTVLGEGGARELRKRYGNR